MLKRKEKLSFAEQVVKLSNPLSHDFEDKIDVGKVYATKAMMLKTLDVRREINTHLDVNMKMTHNTKAMTSSKTRMGNGLMQIYIFCFLNLYKVSAVHVLKS